MAEKTESRRQLDILIAGASAYLLWSLLLVLFGLFGEPRGLLRAEGALLLDLGFVAATLGIFAVTLASGVRARYATPVQFVCIGILAVPVGESAALLFGRNGALFLFDASPVGHGMVVLLAFLAPTMRLLLRDRRKKKVPVYAYLVPCVLVAIPVLRFVRYRVLDAGLVFAVGACLVLGIVLFGAIRLLSRKDLVYFGRGAIVLAAGETVALLLGPSGAVPVDLPQTYVGLARHILILAGLIVLCYAVLRYTEAENG